jgi:hypothetical protein
MSDYLKYETMIDGVVSKNTMLNNNVIDNYNTELEGDDTSSITKAKFVLIDNMIELIKRMKKYKSHDKLIFMSIKFGCDVLSWENKELEQKSKSTLELSELNKCIESIQSDNKYLDNQFEFAQTLTSFVFNPPFSPKNSHMDKLDDENLYKTHRQEFSYLVLDAMNILEQNCTKNKKI